MLNGELQKMNVEDCWMIALNKANRINMMASVGGQAVCIPAGSRCTSEGAEADACRLAPLAKRKGPARVRHQVLPGLIFLDPQRW